MTKKLIALALSLAMAVSCFTACSDSADSSAAETSSTAASDSAADESTTESSDDELKAPVNDGAIALEDLPTENMLTRSIRFEGDTTRLAEKIQDALELNEDDSMEATEKVDYATTIAFLGDSITAGSQASSSQNQYTKQVVAWWEENISLYVKGINAGIGATDSYLAVHRVDSEVLSEEPDIIFIEFINDEDTDFYKTTMESLIRKCLAQPNNPAVILVEMTQEDGTCPQNAHSEIAEYYNVPIISYHDAVLPEIEAGNLAWTDISPDNIHPNDDGHVMLGKMLTNFIETVKSGIGDEDITSEAFDTSSESLMGDKYANATLCDNTSDLITVTDLGDFAAETSPWNFQNGWSTSNGGTATFEIEFKNLGMLYYRTTDGASGTATITVDGVEISELTGDFTDGWGDYAENEEIVSFDETGTHTVTVTVPEGKSFEILRWMIS